MTARQGAFLLVAVAWSWLASPAAADDSYVHVVRPGETLASIAQQYYGDPRRESVLVAENGLTAQGGSAIVVGLRLVVPWVHHHIVEEGETWAQIAERYYGDGSRSFLLVEVNDGSPGEQPDVGEEIVVPYPLRHVAEQNETLRRIAADFYGNEGSDEVRRLRRFNDMRGIRPGRGQVVLVPLWDLTLSEEGERIIESITGEEVVGGDVRALQQEIDERIPELREHVRRGRFAEAVSLGNRLLGAGRLTGLQIVSIQKELATAYVALERHDLAVAAFQSALRRQPDLELFEQRTSPTVLAAYEEAKEAVAEEQAEEDAGAGADAGAEAPENPEQGDQE